MNKGNIINFKQREQLKKQLAQMETRRKELEAAIEKNMHDNTTNFLSAMGIEAVSVDDPAYQAVVSLYAAICANVMKHQELNAIRIHRQKIKTALYPNGDPSSPKPKKKR